MQHGEILPPNVASLVFSTMLSVAGKISRGNKLEDRKRDRTMVARRSGTLSGEKFVRSCDLKDDVMGLSGVHMATQLMQERTSTGKGSREPWRGDRHHISLFSGCSAFVRRDTAASFWKFLWVVGGKLSALQLQVVSGELHISWESNSAGLICTTRPNLDFVSTQ